MLEDNIKGKENDLDIKGETINSNEDINELKNKYQELINLIENNQINYNEASEKASILQERLDKIYNIGIRTASSVSYSSFAESIAPDFDKALSVLKDMQRELSSKYIAGEKSKTSLSVDQQIKWMQEFVSKLERDNFLDKERFKIESQRILPHISLVDMSKYSSFFNKYKEEVVSENEGRMRLDKTPEVIELKKELSEAVSIAEKKYWELNKLKGDKNILETKIKDIENI